MRKAALLAVAAVLVVAAPAAAQGTVAERAAQALQSAPVYQDPSAERALSSSDLAALRRQVASSSAPVYVAILPASAGAPDGVVVDVARATGRRSRSARRARAPSPG